MKRLFALFLLVAFARTSFASTVSGVISAPSYPGVLKNASLSFTLSQAGIVAGSFVLSTTPVPCATDEAGNIVGIAEPLVAPLFSVNYGSGSLAAATYYVRLTYWNASGETQPGPEANYTLTSTGTLTVTGPVYQPSNASGYNVYMSLTPGTETRQATITGFTSYSNSTSLTSGAALPTSNSTVCDVKFNDSIIPTDTTYQVSATSFNGASVPGFPQPWYLSGSSINVTNNYPLAVNRTARFPYPVIANPSSNATQSINSPLTLNGYSLTTGALVLPTNASCPSPAAGQTIFCTQSGASVVSQNGAAYSSIFALSGGWVLAGTDMVQSVYTDDVLVGLSSTDLTPRTGPGNVQGALISPQIYAVSDTRNGRAIGFTAFNSTMTVATGITGTQTTGWPLSFRVCPATGDCSMLGTIEAARFETGGRILFGVTSSEVNGGQVVAGGAIVAVPTGAVTDDQAISISAVHNTYASINSGHTGAGAYEPLAFFTNAGEAGRFTVTNRNFNVGNTADTSVNAVITAERDQNAASQIIISNQTDGTAARVDFAAQQLNGNSLLLGVTGSFFTPGNGLIGAQSHIYDQSPSGLVIHSTNGSITFQPGGNTVEMSLVSGVGVSLNHALPVTSGGTGNTTVWGGAGDLLFAAAGNNTTTDNNISWSSSNAALTAVGGIWIKGATQTSPSTGQYLQEFLTSAGGGFGHIVSYDYGASAYLPVQLGGSIVQLKANGTIGLQVYSSKLNLALGSTSIYANNAAAVAGGLSQGDIYRTGGDPDTLAIVH